MRVGAEIEKHLHGTVHTVYSVPSPAFCHYSAGWGARNEAIHCITCSPHYSAGWGDWE